MRDILEEDFVSFLAVNAVTIEFVNDTFGVLEGWMNRETFSCLERR